MNVLRILAFALAGQQLAEGYQPLERKYAIEATKKLNNFRRNVKPTATNMHEITYDYEAQAKLDAIIEANGPKWMFENYTGEQPHVRQNINGYYISDQLGYPPLFQIGWHDTCGKLGQNCVLVNLNFRMAQANKGCVDYSLCDSLPGSFDRYRSCETNKTWRGSGHPCSYAWVYEPQFLTASITKMACAVLEVPGWKPPAGQLNSYWCFTDGLPSSNDQPYIAGKTGSDCTKVKKKLCV